MFKVQYINYRNIKIHSYFAVISVIYHGVYRGEASDIKVCYKGSPEVYRIRCSKGKTALGGGGGSTIKVMVNSCYVIIIMIKDQQFNKVKLWLIAIIILLEIRILDIKSNGKKVSGGYLLSWSQPSHD